MITLHEILYVVNARQKVTVTVKYDAVANDNITCQKMECFTGYPPDLMNNIDSGTLKHLASVTGVKNGVIQIMSHPVAKLNKYKAYYATGSDQRYIADIIDIEEFAAVNLNDALNQAQSYFGADSDRKLVGINLIEGIG